MPLAATHSTYQPSRIVVGWCTTLMLDEIAPAGPRASTALCEGLIVSAISVQADSEFVSLLAAIRSGACSRAQLDDLQRRCSHELDVSDGILPTRVITTPRMQGTAQLSPVWRLLRSPAAYWRMCMGQPLMSSRSKEPPANATLTS